VHACLGALGLRDELMLPTPLGEASQARVAASAEAAGYLLQALDARVGQPARHAETAAVLYSSAHDEGLVAAARGSLPADECAAAGCALLLQAARAPESAQPVWATALWAFARARLPLAAQLRDGSRFDRAGTASEDGRRRKRLALQLVPVCLPVEARASTLLSRAVSP
jgi:hypothetical protein